MGRKSTVPTGWVSLYSLVLEHRGSHDTDLAQFVADLGGIRVERVGPHGTLAIRSEDVPDWLRWLHWWDRRPTIPRRRKRRSDCESAPPGRRPWRP